MLKKLGIYYRTIKHLKPIQIRYRLWYMLRGLFRKITGHTYPTSIPKEGHQLNLVANCPPSAVCHLPSKTFTFLNQTHSFEGTINWNTTNHGKLWAYNLNYFDYLHQPDLTKQQGLVLIKDFISQIDDNNEGLEPYPISLRGINWIRFLSEHEITDSEIAASLYAQYQILMDNLEYHVHGNHLLENGCSLLFGAFYFDDQQLYNKGKALLVNEIYEQILADGAHYERSAMYHSIIIERLMDCYNLMHHNNCFSGQERLKNKIRAVLTDMLGWLKKMEWSNGSLPEINDHVAEMQPSVADIYDYADRLELEPESTPLGASGYRRYSTSTYQLLADAGDIGPDYVPGHAHADTLSFLLRINGNEVITDTGTSTYENNRRRQIERSTAAHNTVMVAGEEQHEMWSAFRVGRRGHAEILKDASNELMAQHDGFNFINAVHRRSFEFSADAIKITDHIISDWEDHSSVCYLHFSPDMEIDHSGNRIIGPSFQIVFKDDEKVALSTYGKATGYGRQRKAEFAKITFKDKLETIIKIMENE